MTKIIKALAITALAALCLVNPKGTPIASAAEPEEIAIVQENESVNVTDNKEVIEEIDPNIIVIVTEITEDSDIPMPLDLRRTDTYFDYIGDLTGKARYYQGNHFSVDLTSSSDRNDNFTLSLVRVGTLFDTRVAKAEIPRNGFFHVEFLNIYRPDKYRFNFSQPTFTTSHQKGDMTIWDWD